MIEVITGGGGLRNRRLLKTGHKIRGIDARGTYASLKSAPEESTNIGLVRGIALS